jgi:hypothetical protein
MGRNRTAPRKRTGLESSRLAAMLAPLEKPTAKDSARVEPVSPRGPLNEAGELSGTELEILLLEDTLGEAPEEAGHAIL